MQAAICLLPVIPMRRDPSHRSEMVSQVLFGEYVETVDERDDFTQAKCSYDDYEGWVQTSQLTPVAEVMETTTYVGCAQDEVLINGCSKMVSVGTPVHRLGEQLRFGNAVVQYLPSQGCLWNSEEHKGKIKSSLEKVCQQYLYTPYLWGGKSVYGIDCSGFVQQVFKLFGVRLLRDAHLQAGQGEAVASLEDAQLGDLAFFHNEAGRVVHVGIVLNSNKVVHASGRVRIDALDKDGIIHSETMKRTHRFHSIKRFF